MNDVYPPHLSDNFIFLYISRNVQRAVVVKNSLQAYAEKKKANAIVQHSILLCSCTIIGVTIAVPKIHSALRSHRIRGIRCLWITLARFYSHTHSLCAHQETNYLGAGRTRKKTQHLWQLSTVCVSVSLCIMSEEFVLYIGGFRSTTAHSVLSEGLAEWPHTTFCTQPLPQRQWRRAVCQRRAN